MDILTTYITVLGDTWDKISYNVYGSSKFIKEIMESNKDYVSVLIFSAGISLKIPDINKTEINYKLPPWRR